MIQHTVHMRVFTRCPSPRVCSNDSNQRNVGCCVVSHKSQNTPHTRQDTLACRDSDSLHAGLSVVTADSCAGWTLFSLSKSSETVLRAWGVRRGPVPFSVLLDEHEKSEREKTHIQMIYSDTASAFSHHKCACLTQNTCRSEARCARDQIDR